MDHQIFLFPKTGRDQTLFRRNCYCVIKPSNQIHAITFSYDIQFINKIIADFEYGEIILGGSFLLMKDRKINEFLAEVLANAQEAGDAIRKYPQLAVMMKDGNLAIRTPKLVLDHRKIYLLCNDEGKTRVIKSSANMTGRAWNGDQIEHYKVDDSPYCYEEYLKDFETAWEWSEDIPFQIVASKKSDDLIEGNATGI